MNKYDKKFIELMRKGEAVGTIETSKKIGIAPKNFVAKAKSFLEIGLIEIQKKGEYKGDRRKVFVLK